MKDNYSGRERNAELSFREWSKSKHAQYFTPLQFSKDIYALIKKAWDIAYPARHNEYGNRANDPMPKMNVLDHSAGTGRLLLPWLKDGHKVLGIEMDSQALKSLKTNIKKVNTREGDMLRYAKYLKGKFDVVITNPPFGLTWEPTDKDFKFETDRFSGKIESQTAALEIAIKALRDGYQDQAMLIAIIPTTTFTNAKDKAIRNYLYSKTDCLMNIEIPDLFKKEYGIEVSVNLYIGIKHDDYMDAEFAPITEPKNNLIEHAEELGERMKLTNALRPSPSWRDSERPIIPDLTATVDYEPDYTVGLGVKGLEGDAAANGILDYYNSLPTYSPLLGRRVGLKEALFSRAYMIRYGVGKSEKWLKSAGFDVEITDEQRAKLSRLRKKYQFLSAPVYTPRDYQLLAYFLEAKYTAKINADGYKKGNKYQFRPTWQRHVEVVNIENVVNSKGKSKRIITEIDRGYLTLEVKSDNGWITYSENNKKDMKAILRLFELPVVDDINDTHPSVVEGYRKRLDKFNARLKKIQCEKCEGKGQNCFICHGTGYYQLYDYQFEDIARLATKPGAYLGYEMGGGKTISGLAYAYARNSKWTLVICQANLIQNWIDEAAKFGFEIKHLRTHADIDKFKAIRRTVKDDQMRFYVTSYEFLCLETVAKQYDPWTCVRYDQDGNEIHREISRSAKCSRGHLHSEAVQECPKCEDHKGWTGDYCGNCGYSAYTFANARQYSAYKRIMNDFSTAIVDEAQVAKNKSLRGEAVRAMKVKNMLLLSGTIQKGYITDVYWNFSKLLGHGTPLFPYPYRAGAKRFLEEFGTFEMVSEEYKETLTKGRRKMIPEVSNVNRFWRILRNMSIRRLKNEMAKLPPKKKQIILLPMDPQHRLVYDAYAEWAKKVIRKELAKEEAFNMGRIGNCLWKLRFAATSPNDEEHLLNTPDSPSMIYAGTDWNKIQKLRELVKEIHAKGEKVVIYSALRSMVENIQNALDVMNIRYVRVKSTHNARQRKELITHFSENGSTVLLSGLNLINRGFNITSAQNVILTDVEYTPESTDQGEDRVHRTGQDKEVNIYYLLSENTIDIDMLQIITQKRVAIDHAINQKAVYTEVAELMKQVELRNPEMAIAKRLIGESDLEDVEIESIRGEEIEAEGYATHAPLEIEPIQLSLFK